MKILIFLIVLFLCGGEVYGHSNKKTILYHNNTYFEGIDGFKKWVGVLKRYQDDLKRLNAHDHCNELSTMCDYKLWYDALMGDFVNTEHDLVASIDKINRAVNEKIYKHDNQNWTVDDYWATPIEFFVNDGDCEDFAITKYFLLKDFGIKNEDMKITILLDNKQREIHSILQVSINKQWYILDNRTNNILTLDQSPKHYIPLYAINEKGWWHYSIPDSSSSKS